MWVLISILSGVTPEAKLFLLRWLIDDERQVEGSVRDMVKRYGFNDRMVTGALACLMRSNMLKRRTVESGSGRYSYHPTEKLKALRAETELLAGEERENLVRLLLRRKEIGRRETGRKGASRTCLTPVNRLVLLTLLALADDAGVVEGVTYRRLAKLIGIGQGRLQRQMAKLQKLGFVRSIQNPGLPSPFASGLWIYVNLLHEELAGATGGEVALVFKWPKDGGARHLSEVQQLFELAEDPAGRVTEPGGVTVGLGNWRPVLLLNDLDKLRPLLEFLRTQASEDLIFFLQSRLYHYASEILSSNWHDIDEFSHEFRDNVRRMVANDLLPRCTLDSSMFPKAHGEVLKQLTEVMAMLIASFSISLRFQLTRIRWPAELRPFRARLDRLTYVVLPVGNKDEPNQAPTILCYETANAETPRKSVALFLAPRVGGYNAVGPLQDLQDLTDQELSSIGLYGEVGPRKIL